MSARGGLVWTQETILEAGRVWHDAHGRPPSAVDWRKAAPQHPSSRTVIARFGKWNTFLVAAGWPPRKPHRTPAWSRQQIHDAVYMWRVRYGRTPTWRDWSPRVSLEFPSTATVLSVFGSWNRMLEDGGFPVNQSTPQSVLEARQRRREYKREWNRRRRGLEAKPLGRPVTRPEHGSLTGYQNRRCRCAACCAAAAVYRRQWKESRRVAA